MISSIPFSLMVGETRGPPLSAIAIATEGCGASTTALVAVKETGAWLATSVSLQSFDENRWEPVCALPTADTWGSESSGAVTILWFLLSILGFRVIFFSF